MTDTANNQNQVEERRHPTLYFEDGDIAISATSKAKEYIEFYRIDKIFLARHSPIFKDMLSLGKNNSESHNERYDGVPRVHLHDDAEDVAGFIGALYNMATLPLSKPCRDTPRKVEGIMRLAVKYDVEGIRTVILRHIESEWPQTLSEWELLEREKRSFCELKLADPGPRNSKGAVAVEPPDPALAVRFGVEFNCPKILPAAFYELATECSTYSEPVTWDCLHAPDLLALVKGKQSLARCWSDMAYQISIIGGSYCVKRGFDIVDVPATPCKKYGTNYVSEALEEQCTLTDPLGLLYRLGTSLSDDHRDGVFCCVETYEAILKLVKAEAEVIWKSLPQYFGFSDLLS
ncbi:hypothetical protein BDY19DRAFT_881172 [Irpex rosettiformis]|uniref:Uncharacterized protein n=1 Tax=Irpex rosettiformis TaxID=378272 RepID=A0ACB8UKX3_9APHY|nr:hypothetical protein BDY19DRAFT_881172 [Irpex rosettiformis]